LSNTFEPGDVLFGKLGPYLAKTWVAEFPARCTTGCLVMQPVAAEARFLRYVCLWRDFIDAVDTSTSGSKMPRADWDFIGNMSVPVPEWPVQVRSRAGGQHVGTPVVVYRGIPVAGIQEDGDVSQTWAMNRTNEAAFATVIEAHLLQNGYVQIARVEVLRNA
jgi:hypothetical protein